MRSIVVIIAAAAVTGGCTSGSSSADKRGADAPMTVQRLDSTYANYYRYNSALEDSARYVVRSRDEWTALWNRIVANHGPKPAVPEIDFEKEMLLVAAMGTKTTGGYSIEIEAVDRDSSAITVSVRGRSPGKNCGTTAALTAPGDIVRIPRSDHPGRFVEETIGPDCS
jgi:hypothetical protein